MPLDPNGLRDLPLFAGLSDTELEEVARWVEPRSAAAGERLVLEGASGYRFFVIKDGSVDVTRDGELVETLGPGDFLGEMAILGGSRRNATVTAASPVELLVMFGTEFRSLEEAFPAAAERIRRKMSERVQRMSD